MFKVNEALEKYDSITKELEELETIGIITSNDRKRLKNRRNPHNHQRHQLVRNWKKSIFELHELELDEMNDIIPESYIFNDAILPIPTIKSTPKFHLIDATTTMGVEYIYKFSSNIAILNFANRRVCGGGVKNGSSAQEEELCRLISPLYRSMNKLKYPLKSNDVWITPTKITHHEDYSKRESPIPITVISAAAPNFNSNIHGGSDYNIWCTEAEELMHTLICKILHAAISIESKVIVLGAFGCGAFCGPVDKISQIMREEVLKVSNHFDHIVIAIPKFGNENDINFDTFHKTFVDLLSN